MKTGDIIILIAGVHDPVQAFHFFNIERGAS